MISGISSYFIVAFVPYAGIILVLLLVNGFSGMVMPALNAMMSQRAPASQQGELQGLIGSLSAFSLMIGQFSYNYALAAFTEAGAAIRFPGAPYLLAAIAGLGAFVALTMLRRRQMPEAMPDA
jgi:DHA1 family tetracycline resistance protein-like MFS transporter